MIEDLSTDMADYGSEYAAALQCMYEDSYGLLRGAHVDSCMVLDSTFNGVERSAAAPLLCLGPAPDYVLHVEGEVAQVDQDPPHAPPPHKGGSPRRRPIGLCGSRTLSRCLPHVTIVAM